MRSRTEVTVVIWEINDVTSQVDYWTNSCVNSQLRESGSTPWKKAKKHPWFNLHNFLFNILSSCHFSPQKVNSVINKHLSDTLFILLLTLFPLLPETSRKHIGGTSEINNSIHQMFEHFLGGLPLPSRRNPICISGLQNSKQTTNASGNIDTKKKMKKPNRRWYQKIVNIPLVVIKSSMVVPLKAYWQKEKRI